MKIPKLIHYCWLSDDPVPNELLNYMKSWENTLKDYKFIKWDLKRFDISSSIWTKEAFENKKYAFAADYIRMYALYTMGGIYLDMDVEVLKSFDNLLDLNYFICYENSKTEMPEVATLGAQKGCSWIKSILNYYNNRHFIKRDGSYDMIALPKVVKKVLIEQGMTFYKINSPLISFHVEACDKTLLVLPCDYFSPKSYSSGKISITNNTYSIHHFSGSWLPVEQRLEKKICNIMGIKYLGIMYKLDKFLYLVFKIKR